MSKFREESSFCMLFNSCNIFGFICLIFQAGDFVVEPCFKRVNFPNISLSHMQNTTDKCTYYARSNIQPNKKHDRECPNSKLSLLGMSCI